MAIKDLHYNAFISYRHSEPDAAVATALHRALEKFRLPGNLRKKYPKERWKIDRVFRDQDELPLAENLSEPIEQAIANSDFLIVICSPRLPESAWCAKEIALFKKLHGLDHILAVLVEGEPEQSFPEGIRFKDVPVTNERGETVILRQEVEPLAADVRAADPRTRKKMIEDAVMRLAAPMYGLGYDELRQRHREQKIRRVAGISGICAGVFFVFGMVCLGLSMKISAQKEIIEEQHQSLQEQYLEEQIKYAESMAVVSETLLGEGRSLDALYALRSAMPDTKEDETLPYVSETEYALACALAAYDSEAYVPQEVLPLPEKYEFWGEFEDYRYLEDSLAGQYIMAAQEQENGEVWIITNQPYIYIFQPDENLLINYYDALFADVPEGHLNAAVFYGDKLYMQYTGSDYMVCYQWKENEGRTGLGVIDREDREAFRGHILEKDEEAWSDDGKYRIRAGANNSVYFYQGERQKVAQTLYDIHASVYGLKRIPGTGYYVLLLSGRDLLLNENLERIARIPNYYGYDEDKKELILYRQTAPNTSTYELYGVPLLSYEDLIDQADDLLKGYEPSEEIRKRYRMLE